jgi:transposase
MLHNLPPDDFNNRPGFVSPHCQCSLTDGVCFITVRGQLMGGYELDDRAAQRSLWVQVYRAGHATQVQISRYLKISLRTFHGWVGRYRESGMAGLLDQPKSGRPRLADESKQKRVVRSRAAGKTIYEIAQIANLSVSTINRILGRKQPKPAPVPELALGTSASSASPLAVVAEPVLMEPAADSRAVGVEASGEPVMAAIPTAAVGEVQPRLAPEALAVALTGTPVEPSGLIAAAGVVKVGVDAAVEAVGGEVPLVVAASAETVLPAREGSLSSSTPGVDPVDRSADRVLARLGLLEDAPPVFAPGKDLPWVGAFLALALLEKDPLLQVAGRVFGSLGCAFYGLRTVMVTLVILALLRIKKPEHLRQHQAEGLGRVLGLDRVPEVKTLRRKLHALSQPLQGAGFLEALARERAAGYQQPVRVACVDGHVEVYTGHYPIGQVYAASHSRVVKGTTRTWVNLPGAKPLFCVSGEFNEGLVAVLPKVMAKVQEVLGTGPVIAIFDRGGFCGRLFEQQIAAGHTILTYRKGKTKDWPLEQFEKQETRIGSRTYAYAPAEAEVDIPVHEAVAPATGQKGAPAQGKTGRTVRMREIRVIRDDGGQTSVLVGNSKAPAVELCGLLFGRWGAQENVFKYLLAEYDLNGTVEYGDEPLSLTITHPNPAYVKGQKALAGWVIKRNQHLAKLGIKLTAEPWDGAALAQRLAQWKQRPQAAQVQAAQAQIEKLRSELAKLPERVPAGQSGLRRLKSEMKLLSIALKLTAYELETQLLERIRPHYPNHAKEGRKLITAALRSPGSIRLQPGQIWVKLAPQTSANRTRAVAKLCESLNQLNPLFPGTKLRIVFESPLT